MKNRLLILCVGFSAYMGCSRPDSIPDATSIDQPYQVNTVGGKADEELYAIAVTADQGFMAVGQYDSAYAVGRTITGLAVRLDSTGNILWQKKTSGSFKSVVQSRDGGFLMGGSGGLLVKLDAQGNLVRVKTIDDLGVRGSSSIDKLIRAADGGYIGVGSTNQKKFNADVIAAEETAGFVFKINEAGDIVWFQTILLKGAVNKFTDVISSANGDYVVVGITNFDYVTQRRYPLVDGSDGWVVRISPTGRILWQKGFRGPNGLQSVAETGTGELLAAGNIFGNPRYDSNGGLNVDGWLGRFTSEGSILWQKQYGGDGYELFYSLIAMGKEDYLIGGHSESQQTKKDNSDRYRSAWLMQINGQGENQQSKLFGGGLSSFQVAYDEIKAIASNGRRYVAVGYTQSIDGDIKRNGGGKDAMIISLKNL